MMSSVHRPTCGKLLDNIPPLCGFENIAMEAQREVSCSRSQSSLEAGVVGGKDSVSGVRQA